MGCLEYDRDVIIEGEIHGNEGGESEQCLQNRAEGESTRM